ncbi:MAG TPA: ribosome-associated translation inhibitor RaiA [Syntrophales bacterium]|nr:ribosome-associated translation inhibitor RaiA [Syntrophales bacterium]HOX95110.1 ribosome-associated translation inhibitor RaiA [Syntrophales bacterium]HPI55842.1 ribosome-associated translation inhibitor RaiA [Syntrophales bacterium]HPN23667.1 ribosome-associated translation inhibitor RaiA [Syntrophales bacterium]HQM27808.1 ribosome-associated translation inhibitor RaiA [Syntrophales bacterium]
MQISVTFRNTESEDWFKDYITERLKKLQKYIDKPLEAHVVLSVEKFRNVAEVNVSARGVNINGKEEAKDMQLAVDTVIDKIERQMKKHKEKLRGHKSTAAKGGVMTRSRADEELDEEPVRLRIVETKKMVLRPMSLDEAIMEIEGSKNRFIIYRDAGSENIHVIYRRDDGDYALIEANS